MEGRHSSEVWARPLADGTWAIARYSIAGFETEWFGLSGPPSGFLHGLSMVAIFWTGTELRGELSGEFSGAVPAHGVVLWRLR